MIFNKRLLLISKYIFIPILILSLSIGVASTASAAVRPPKFSIKSLYMTKKATYKLRVYNTSPDYKIEFKSEDPDIVRVTKIMSKYCRLKPVSIGSTTISATVYDKDMNVIEKLRCKVNVSIAAVSIKFAKKKIGIIEGNTKFLKTIIKPNISKEFPIFTSDDNKIATISTTGVITAVSPGQTTVRATLENGKTATCLVTVRPPKNPDEEKPDDENTDIDKDTPDKEDSNKNDIDKNDSGKDTSDSNNTDKNDSDKNITDKNNPDKNSSNKDNTGKNNSNE